MLLLLLERLLKYLGNLSVWETLVYTIKKIDRNKSENQHLIQGKVRCHCHHIGSCMFCFIYLHSHKTLNYLCPLSTFLDEPVPLSFFAHGNKWFSTCGAMPEAAIVMFSKSFASPSLRFTPCLICLGSIRFFLLSFALLPAPFKTCLGIND